MYVSYILQQESLHSTSLKKTQQSLICWDKNAKEAYINYPPQDKQQIQN